MLGQFILRNFLYSSFVGYRHVRGVRQPRINLVEIADQNAKRNPLKLVVFRGVEDFIHHLSLVASHFPYIAESDGTPRTENRRSKGLYVYSHSMVAGGLEVQSSTTRLI